MEHKQSEEIGELAAALVKAQAKFPAIIADHEADAGKYKYNYATLSGTWSALREHLTGNDLCVIQTTQNDERDLSATVVVTTLAHKSGQWIRGYLSMPAGSHAQSHGIAISYARRYALQAIVGAAVAKDDDEADGDAAEMWTSKQMKTKCWKALRDAAAEGDSLKARETWDEIDSNQQQDLWRELSSGQRSTLKKLLKETEESTDDVSTQA